MTPTEPTEPEEGKFHDEGAGPEEDDEVINEPENQEAADAIRATTVDPEEVDAAGTYGAAPPPEED